MALGRNIGEASIEVGADASGFESDLRSSGEPAARKAGSAIASALGTTLKVGLAAVATGVGLTLGVAFSQGFKRLDSIDKATRKLEGLGHSAEGIEDIMDSALASVKGTAFGLGDAATLAATAVASGIEPGKELTDQLKLMADTATIAGAPLSDIGAIFGKITTGGKLTGETLAMLQERGIPVLQFLAEELGKTPEAISEMVSSGQIDMETFAAAMEENIGGSALKSGETFSGALANVKAALGRLGATLLEPGFEAAKGLFASLIVVIDKITESLQPLVDKYGPMVASVIDKIGSGLEGAVSGGGGFMAILGPLAPLLGAAIGPLSGMASSLPIVGGAFAKIPGPVGAAVAGLAALTTIDPSTLFSGFQTLADQLPTMIHSAVNVVVGLIRDMIPQLVTTLTQNIPIFVNGVSMIITAIADRLPMLIGLLVGAFVQLVPQLVTALVSMIPNLIAAIVNLVSALIEAIVGMIPMLIQGAIQLFTGLVQALVQVIPLVIEGLLNLITSLVEALIQALPMILEGAIQLFLGLVQAVIEILPQVIDAILNLVMDVISTLLDMLPTLLDTAIELFLSLVLAVADILPDLIEAILDLLPKILDAVISMIPALLDAAIDLFTSLVESIPVILPQLLSAIIGMLPRIISSVIGMIPQLLSAAIELFLALVEAIPRIIPELIGAIPQIISAIVSALAQAGPQLLEAGKNIIRSLIDGIKNMVGAVGDAIGGVVSTIRNFLPFSPAKMGPLRVNPPDVAGLKIGEMIADGITMSEKDVKKAMAGLSGTASVGLDMGMGARRPTRPTAAAAPSTTSIEVHIDVERIRDLGTVADFLDMLERSRLTSRQVERSGVVRVI